MGSEHMILSGNSYVKPGGIDMIHPIDLKKMTFMKSCPKQYSGWLLSTDLRSNCAMLDG